MTAAPAQTDETEIVLLHILDVAERATKGDEAARVALLKMIRPDEWYRILGLYRTVPASPEKK